MKFAFLPSARSQSVNTGALRVLRWNSVFMNALVCYKKISKKGKCMTVDHASYERLLQYRIPEIEHTMTTRDTMLYALGVGLGADPMDEQQLRFVYEKNLAALPTMAVILAAPHAWLK